MSKIEQLEKRIIELEAEIARLKAIPAYVVHSHYHYAQPAWIPQPEWKPHYPQVTWGYDNQTVV